MIHSNEDLQEAYVLIREMYRSKGMVPGKVKKIGYRNKWNYVLAGENQSGIAFNFTGDHAVYGEVEDLEQFINLRPYIGTNLWELVEFLLGQPGLQMRSLCLAALNALSDPLTNPDSLQERGIIASEEEDYDFVSKEDIVTVIGYGGIVSQVYGRCQELHVNDMRPKRALQTLAIGEKIEYGPEKIIFHPAEENAEVLGKSNVVLMSGCTIVNGTFQELIAYAKQARIIGMYGPSAQIIPDFLLGKGLNYISSRRIVNHSGIEDRLMNALDLGGAFKSDMKAYYVKRWNDKAETT